MIVAKRKTSTDLPTATPSPAMAVNEPGGVQRPATKTEFAVAVLKAEILAGRFQPGEQLNFVHLSRRLGISATPVREAIRILQAQGLVDESPHKRVSVTELSDEDIDELFMLRELLEPLATELAVNRITDHQIARLRELLEIEQSANSEGDYAKASAANADWHFYLYDIADSTYLKDFIERLWHGVKWGNKWLSRPKVIESDRQHQEIMKAIELRSPRAAGELMALHIRSGKERQIAHREATAEK